MQYIFFCPTMTDLCWKAKPNASAAPHHSATTPSPPLVHLISPTYAKSPQNATISRQIHLTTWMLAVAAMTIGGMWLPFCQSHTQVPMGVWREHFITFGQSNPFTSLHGTPCPCWHVHDPPTWVPTLRSSLFVSFPTCQFLFPRLSPSILPDTDVVNSMNCSDKTFITG
jgi:hypothetical protein